MSWVLFIDKFFRPKVREKVKHRKVVAGLYNQDASGEIVTRNSQVSPPGVLRLGIRLPRLRVLFLECYCMKDSGPSACRIQRQSNSNISLFSFDTYPCVPYRIELLTCEAPARQDGLETVYELRIGRTCPNFPPNLSESQPTDFPRDNRLHIMVSSMPASLLSTIAHVFNSPPILLTIRINYGCSRVLFNQN